MRFKAAGIFLTLFLISCSGLHIYNPTDDSRSLVFGYIDMEEAPVPLKWARFKQVEPRTDKPYLILETDGSGIFFHDQVVKGSYLLASFGGHKTYFFYNPNYGYQMPEYGENPTQLVIRKPGIYYMGTYRFKKAGTFFNSKFDIQRASSPSERDLLEKLLITAKGTKWESRIQHRIHELR